MDTKINKTNGLTENENDIEQCFKAFIIDRKSQNLTKGTIGFYSLKIERFIKYCKSQSIYKMNEITPETIRLFLLDLPNSEGGKAAFYRSIKAWLLFFENEFEPENYRNPIRKVKSPKKSIEPIEGISISDFNKLVECCDNKSYFGIRDKTILLVLLETGLRASELCNLKTEDINFMDSSILVRQGKGRKPRFVFIGRTVKRQLRSWLKTKNNNSNFLFTTTQGDRFIYSTLREIVRRRSIKAEIPTPGLHDFRRTFALQCLKNRVDIQSIARLMGHTSLQVLSTYLKQTKGDIGDCYQSILDN